MLSEKEMREAAENVRQYLRDGMLERIKAPDKNISNTMLRNSEESLLVADFLHKNGMSPLWVIVSSYYSMYYIANAVLYGKGCKVGRKISHKVTNDTLIVFVKDALSLRLLEDFQEARAEAMELAGAESEAENIIKSFDLERKKRSKFQYSMAESAKAGMAATSLARAKNFVTAMKRIIV